MGQSFQQKRIVELSRQLDLQRDKNAKLTRESIFLSSKLKQAQQQLEKDKEKQLEIQISNHQLVEQMNEFKLENMQLKDQLTKLSKEKEDKELQSVRYRQQIEEMKAKTLNYELDTKDLLFKRTAELGEREKQVHRLKEENVEIEKVYLSKREQFNRKEERRVKEMAKLIQQVEYLRREIKSFMTQTEKMIMAEKQKQTEALQDVVQHIKSMSHGFDEYQQMQKELVQLHCKLEMVVSENSQKIIDLYKMKYAT